MTNLLIRLFVKDSENLSSSAVRQKYGLLSSCTGIVMNALLFAFKLFAGMITGSIAVTADAFNNLSDMGSSVMTLIGFRMSEMKPDKNHPFGHGRIEYLSGLFVAFAILIMGLELFKSSAVRIIHPEKVEFSTVSAIILAVSIAAKLFMCSFNKTVGEKINSAAVKAAAADSMGDAIATSAVLLGSVIGRLTNFDIDGYLGIIVSGVIFLAGIEAAKDTINPLLGAAPDPELIKKITDAVMAHEEIKGVHDLIIHDYGPGRVMISLHAEVSASGSFVALHDVIDNIERELCSTFKCQAVIHMDPVETDNKAVNELKEKTAQLAQVVDSGITIHDFRVAAGPTHTNIIFDIVLPRESDLTPEEAKSRIQQALSVLDENYFAVITVDRPYV